MEIDNDFKLCCLPRAKKKNQSIMDNIFQNKKKTCLALNTHRPKYILTGTSRLSENNKLANIQKLQ